MIPAGRHTARAMVSGWGKTKNGNHEFAIEFEIVGGEANGERIVAYLYFTDGAFDRSIESLRACGWQGDDLGMLGTDDSLGRNEVQLIVEHETYDGKNRARVKWINRAGGIPKRDELPKNELRSFAATMKGRIKALDAVKGNGGGTAARPQPAANGTGQRPGAAATPRPAAQAPADDALPPDDFGDATGSDDEIPF